MSERGGQTRTSSLGAARPLPPSPDIGPGGQSVGQAAQFCLADSTPSTCALFFPPCCCVPLPFIEPCLPSPGEQPPTGPNCVHEIKHDGYRLMARRDPVSAGIKLLTRNGHDWTSRYPLIVQAVNKLKARSCLRHRGNDQDVVLVAFDLLQIHFALGRSLGALSVCWPQVGDTSGFLAG